MHVSRYMDARSLASGEVRFSSHGDGRHLAETGRDRYGKRLQLTRAEAAQPPAAISTTVPGIGPAAR